MATRNLLVRAGFDASGMTRGTRQANTALRNFGQTANRSMSGLSSTMGTSLGKIGKLLAGVFAVKAIASFGKQCIDLGSDLAEVQNVVDVTFGDMAQSINDFASTAIEKFGLSETAAKKYAGVFGSMSTSMGLSKEAALEMSKSVTGLTGDVASFFNLSNDEAYTKLKSIWTGETETLKDLGVVMTQTNLKQFALSQGITKSIDKMTEAEKVMLRYEYVTKALSNAQGDFARNSDSWANQTRILSERFNALKATIGQGLISVFSPIIKWLNVIIERLQVAANAFTTFTNSVFGSGKKQETGAGIVAANENMTDLGNSADDATDSIKKVKGALAGFDEVNTLSKTDTDTSSQVSTGSQMPGVDLSSIDNQINEQMSAGAAAIKEVFDKFKSIDLSNLTNSLNKVKEALAPITQTLFNGLKWGLDNVIFPISKWTMEEALPAFLNLIAGALKVLNPLIEAFKPLATFLWNNFLAPIAAWTGGVIVSTLNGLASALSVVGDWMKQNQPVVTGITSALATFFGVWKVAELLAFIQMSGGIVGAFTAMTTAIKTNVLAKIADKAETVALTLLYAKDFVVSLAKSTLELGKQAVAFVASKAAMVGAKVAQIALTTATIAWNAICAAGTAATTAFGVAVAILTSPVTLVIGAIAALVAGVVLLIKNWDTVKEVGAKAWEGIKAAWSGACKWFDTNIITPLGKAFSGMWEGVKTACTTAFNGLATIIKAPINSLIDLINGFLSGLSNVSIDIPDWVPGVGGKTLGMDIPKIPKLARGGIINSPTIAQIGEAGPEAVVPLENTGFVDAIERAVGNGVMNAMQFGSNNNSTGAQVVIEMDGKKIAQGIISDLETEWSRRGVRLGW